MKDLKRVYFDVKNDVESYEVLKVTKKNIICWVLDNNPNEDVPEDKQVRIRFIPVEELGKGIFETPEECMKFAIEDIKKHMDNAQETIDTFTKRLNK